MSDVPSGLLGDFVSQISGGGTPSRENSEYWTGKIPWVSVKDLASSNPESSAEKISEEGLASSASRLIPAGIPIVATRMAVGRSAVFSIDVAINQDLKAIFPNEEMLDRKYLCHFLKANEETLASKGTGSTVKGIRLEDLEQLPIVIPPLPEQKKIAEILSGIDAIIQKQKRKAITLGHLQASLIKDITLGTKEEGSRQATDIGECPADWRATKLGDIAEFANGNSFKSEDWQENGYPIIRIQTLNGGSDFNYFSGRIDEKWFVPRGSLLFAWSGQRGKSFGPFIWNGQDGVLNQHIFKVTHDQDIDRDFLFLLLKMVQLNAERDAHGFKDSFMHVKKSDIVTTSIAIPPVEAQRRLTNSYKQVSMQISLEERKLESLKNLKYSISSDLLSGRKRVSV